MQANALNRDCIKTEKERLEDMFDEADMWLLTERVMDSLIISGVRIYFPKPGEQLPVPPDDIHSFAVKGTIGERCCLLAYLRKNWHVLAPPDYEHSGAAIMEAVRRGKCP